MPVLCSLQAAQLGLLLLLGGWQLPAFEAGDVKQGVFGTGPTSRPLAGSGGAVAPELSPGADVTWPKQPSHADRAIAGWGLRRATALGLRGAAAVKGAAASGGRRHLAADAGAGLGNGGGGSGGSSGASGGLCTDTCRLARNGICEDGSQLQRAPPPAAGGFGGSAVAFKTRLGSSVQVSCDFGTDCTDCGPYRGVVSSWGQNQRFAGPVDYLSRQGIKLLARRVAFEPHFVFGYTDPKDDLDVSEQMERAGCVELGVVRVFKHVLAERCGRYRPNTTAAAAAAAGANSSTAGAGARGSHQPPPGLPALVVDVGANFGFFTAYAAAMGCRVVAVEPVPRFLAFLHWTLAANGIRAVAAGDGGAVAAAGGGGGGGGGGERGYPWPVSVVDRVVTGESGGVVTMTVPRKGVWGTATIATQIERPEEEQEKIRVNTTRLDDIVSAMEEEVALLKVDVEGFEPVVFKSGEALLASGRVANVLLEYSPGMPETLEHFFPGQALDVVAEDPPRMLQSLLRRGGYTALQLPDNFAKSGFLPEIDRPLPEFPQVLPESVQYDLADVGRFRAVAAPGAPCPWPPELVAANPLWNETCLRPPEDCHPKGLRVSFAYNTNLWLIRNRTAAEAAGVRVGGPVGLFAPEQDLSNSWWSARDPTQAVGNRACPFLPAFLLLRNRCNCTKPDVCGAEQAALLKALQEGRMPLPAPLNVAEGAT
ncbi:hypothetical protein HXX76_012693 [Chlamydomonas incerta]|uniref:Methyltransferase FkbM domain-containing protein n=1 Tax=Chlamydomonas incerta TaxID=51695 RepID=A0A835SW13_CHLIN|nr:hypothetical protein HXX76_012693 [Chlamydomonas incerta]|eukprot:KAG2426906.1 hypothetical protein HXX76_012693 [Chlamydomonas incerta]